MTQSVKAKLCKSKINDTPPSPPPKRWPRGGPEVIRGDQKWPEVIRGGQMRSAELLGDPRCAQMPRCCPIYFLNTCACIHTGARAVYITEPCCTAPMD